jgi:hypothetical protein
MKKNLIAILLTAIIFVQIIPLASFIQIAKSFDNQIALSLSLEQLEEDNLDNTKIFTNKVDDNLFALKQLDLVCKVHFSQNHIKPNKGFVSIIIPPPNFNA